MLRIESCIWVVMMSLAGGGSGYVTTVSNADLAAARVVKVDFDQTFADAAAGYRALASTISAAPSGKTATSIDRTNKGDRLSQPSASASPEGKAQVIVIRRPVPPPKVGCETVAAPYADLVLGRIVGRCLV